MTKAFVITLLSLLHNSAFAFPAPQNDPQPNQNAKFQWQIWKNCSQENKEAIFRAWEDSKRFADALNSWKPKKEFQPAMEMYMGDRCTYSDIFGYNFPKQIQDTARRERGIYEGVSEYYTANLWVYCNEDSRWWAGCTEDRRGTVLAYEEESIFFNNWYITFCPHFYEPEYNRPLNTVIQDIKDRNLDPMIIENWYGVQGATFFHETMHMSQLVTSPQAKDYDGGYTPEGVYNLSRTRNTDAAVYNAESWTIVAQAIFAQQEMGLKDPPYPRNFTPQGVAPGNVREIPENYIQSSVEKAPADFVPEGVGEHSTGPYFVNPDLWEVYNPNQTQDPPPGLPQPSEDKLVCNEPNDPLVTDRWTSRDGFIAAIDQFCTDIDGITSGITKTYKENTYDGTKFELLAPGGPEDSSIPPMTKDRCKQNLERVVDGCVPASNNPMNWKYGGVLEAGGRWRFEANPWGKQNARKANADKSPLQAPIAKCDSFYQIARDEFWIYGAGFLDGDFGIELFNQMSDCVGSDVTDWAFEYYDKPDADGYEWKAFGHTPIWQKNCFSSVIKGAGGPDIPCNGSG